MELGVYIVPYEATSTVHFTDSLFSSANIVASQIVEAISLKLLLCLNGLSRNVVCVLYHIRPPHRLHSHVRPTSNTNTVVSQIVKARTLILFECHLRQISNFKLLNTCADIVIYIYSFYYDLLNYLCVNNNFLHYLSYHIPSL
jgi:hypothetical protein